MALTITTAIQAGQLGLSGQSLSAMLQQLQDAKTANGTFTKISVELNVNGQTVSITNTTPLGVSDSATIMASFISVLQAGVNSINTTLAGL